MSGWTRRRFLATSAALATSPTLAQPTSSSVDELFRLDAIAQSALIRKKEMSAKEIIAATIARIERLNPKINAVVTKMFDRALARAERPLPDGPLAGVPTLIKDMEPVRFVRLTYGSEYFKNFISPFSNELVDRMDRAGMITVGKSNLPEFGLMPCTEPRLFGPTNNPWKLTHSPGGSSGGSASAVAAGMVPIAQGGDGGGSIRIPASCCGIFGFKVSRGFNPYGGGSPGVDVATRHCLSRTVRDSAAFFDAVQGALPGDRYFLPRPMRSMLSVLETEPEKLRIGFVTADPHGREAHKDCQSAVLEAAKLCEELGHEVFPARWPITNPQRYHDAFLLAFSAMAASAVQAIEQAVRAKPPREALEPMTWWLVEKGHRHSAADIMAAWQALDEVSTAMARLHQKCDVLLTPVLNQPPVKSGEFAQSQPPEVLLPKIAAYMGFTAIANTTGQPAMSVPLHWNAEGLPIGVQFMGRFAEDSRLFRLAAQLEDAHPWAERFPAVTSCGKCGHFPHLKRTADIWPA